ncbi:MAG: HIT family protein [Acidimicrobiales bacterium]
MLQPALTDPDCLFCRIIRGEEQAEVVLDEPHAMAFLDVRPVFPGHTLLVPRDHHETLSDLPGELIGPVFRSAQRLAKAVETGMDAHGTFVAANNRVSQSVPHFHVHVVPRRRKDGLRGFFWPRNPYPSIAERAEVAARIRSALDR